MPIEVQVYRLAVAMREYTIRVREKWPLMNT